MKRLQYIHIVTNYGGFYFILACLFKHSQKTLLKLLSVSHLKESYVDNLYTVFPSKTSKCDVNSPTTWTLSGVDPGRDRQTTGRMRVNLLPHSDHTELNENSLTEVEDVRGGYLGGCCIDLRQ